MRPYIHIFNGYIFIREEKTREIFKKTKKKFFFKFLEFDRIEFY